MARLSDHDLRQMSEEWVASQSEPVIRGLVGRLLEDLRVARDRLNQSPQNSSRPSGSMPPWDKTGRAADAGQADSAATDGEPGASGEPQADEPACGPAGGPQAIEAQAAPAGVPAAAPAQVIKRSPGRQPGAQGHGRTQVLEPEKTVRHYPRTCAACQAVLPATATDQAVPWNGWTTLEMVGLNGEPWVRAPQTAPPALPVNGDGSPRQLGLRIEVTRHVLMTQRCSCGHESRAQAHVAPADSDWPQVEIGQRRLLGPRLAAALVHLCVRMRLPRRKVSELMWEWLGLSVSPALIDQAVHQSARSVAPLEQALADALEETALMYADETSWSEAGQALWLWVLCSAHTVLYLIGARSKEMFANAVNFQRGGWLMSDGYLVYRDWELRLRCWAHLLRKLRGLSESSEATTASAGSNMLGLFTDLMAAVFDARKHMGPQPEPPQPPSPTDPGLAFELTPAHTHAAVVEQLRLLCELHRDAKYKNLREVAREFLNDWQAIMRVLAQPHLPLTNNFSERQLRHYVIWRRISYGTRTPAGSRSVSLLASIFDTCRLRGVSATEFLASAIHAARLGLPTPALPPIPAALLSANLAPQTA